MEQRFISGQDLASPTARCRAAYFGVPAEDDYGYAQAIKIGNTIHVAGPRRSMNLQFTPILYSLLYSGDRRY